MLGKDGKWLWKREYHGISFLFNLCAFLLELLNVLLLVQASMSGNQEAGNLKAAEENGDDCQLTNPGEYYFLNQCLYAHANYSLDRLKTRQIQELQVE